VTCVGQTRETVRVKQHFMITESRTEDQQRITDTWTDTSREIYTHIDRDKDTPYK